MSDTVVCVLRGGGEYTPDHVRALYQGVRQWWPRALRPLRFVALTDTPIEQTGVEERPLRNTYRGWWAKMDLFAAAQDDLGDILYFDLDTMIVGDLEQIVAARGLILLRDFYYSEKAQSGMMHLPAKVRPEAMAAFMEGAMSQYHGDGEFLDALWRHRAKRWQDALVGQVVSYKVHVRQRRGQTVPPNARVVCFHGRPRPWDSPLWHR